MQLILINKVYLSFFDPFGLYQETLLKRWYGSTAYFHFAFNNYRLKKSQFFKEQFKANQLLDEMGLDRRDAEGYRLGPDGKTFVIAFLNAM